jgi:hypothetical protein
VKVLLYISDQGGNEGPAPWISAKVK